MRFSRIVTAIAFSLCLFGRLEAVELKNLKILYVGDSGTSRSKAVTGFLKKNAGSVESADRNGFKPERAQAFDVVVVDWPYSDTVREEWHKPCFLGDRFAWSKPTVLLGSAGLNLAIVWKARGGAG